MLTSGTQTSMPLGIAPVLIAAASLPWLLLSLPVTGWFGELLPYDQHRVVQLGALIFSGLMVSLMAKPWVHGTHALGMHGLALVAVVMVVGLLSASQSARPMLAVQEVVVWGLIVCCGLQVAGWCQVDSGSDRVLAGLAAVSVVGHILSFFVGYLGILQFGPPVMDTHMVPGYGNYRVFNHYQTWLFPIVLSFWRWVPERPGWRVGTALLSGLWFSMAYVTGARATLFAVAVAIAAALIVFRKHAVLLARSALAGALIGAALWAIAFLALPTVMWGVPAVEDSGLMRVGLSRRDVLWTQAAELLRQSPWLGVGPMHFAYFPNPVSSGPHNFSLQLAAEWGLPVAVLVCFGIGLALIRHVAAIRRQPDPAGGVAWLDVVLWVSLLAGAIDAQLSDSMNMPMSQMWMLLVAGWALGRASRGLGRRRGTTGFRGIGIPGRLIPVALAVLVFVVIWPTPTKLSEIYVRNRACCFTEIPRHRHYSYRFWRQGWILPGSWSDSKSPEKRETLDPPAPRPGTT